MVRLLSLSTILLQSTHANNKLKLNINNNLQLALVTISTYTQLADNSWQTLDGNSSAHSEHTNSSSLTCNVRCCLKLARREKLLSHSGHVRLFSLCNATCKRRFSGILYVCEHCGQRYGLSFSWFLKCALYLLSLSNSIPHKSHVWTPYKANIENINQQRCTIANIFPQISRLSVHNVNTQSVAILNIV